MTLGIPRLQEILQRASEKIKTPVMTCPLCKGRTRQVFLLFYMVGMSTQYYRIKKIHTISVASHSRAVLQIIFAHKLMDDCNNDTIYCTKFEVEAVLAIHF